MQGDESVFHGGYHGSGKTAGTLTAVELTSSESFSRLMKLRLIADRHRRMTDNDRGLMNAKL